MAFFIALFLPSAPYVKVYLLNNGAYVAKKKTKIARKTLDPLYQQALLFEESPQGKVLQVSRRFISLHHKVKCFPPPPTSCWRKLSRATWQREIIFSFRWLYGETMAAWTIKASWELHKSYWRSWTYQAQSSVGTSCSHHPLWWIRHLPPWRDELLSRLSTARPDRPGSDLSGQTALHHREKTKTKTRREMKY